MNFKLNIIEPWEYGTERALDAVIVKEYDLEFLLFVHEPRKIKEATAHYFVYKLEEKSVIKTKIRLLNKEEQIETVAKMLSGEKPTDSSLVTAKEMVLG